MKKLIKNLILFLIVATTQGVFAYSLSYEELKDEIMPQVHKEAKLALEQYSSDFTVTLAGVPKVVTITQEQTKPRIEVINENPNFTPVSYRRILIKDSKGNLIKSFAINVHVRVYSQVMVASEMIPYDRVIGTHNAKMERREITQYLGKIYTKMTPGIISKRNYQKGNIILSTGTKAKSSILKNSSIDIVFISKGLNIKLRGKALKDGAIGETILVKSDKYNKTYTATVKSENEVIVRI